MVCIYYVLNDWVISRWTVKSPCNLIYKIIENRSSTLSFIFLCVNIISVICLRNNRNLTFVIWNLIKIKLHSIMNSSYRKWFFDMWYLKLGLKDLFINILVFWTTSCSDFRCIRSKDIPKHNRFALFEPCLPKVSTRNVKDFFETCATNNLKTISGIIAGT